MVNWNKSLLYEQPINELMRLCLRFERLFAQIGHYFQGEDRYDSRAALVALLEILNMADRSDLKASITKELSRYYGNLVRLQQVPTVDHSRLTGILDELDTTITELNDMNGKFGQKLRNDEFLNSVRLQLSNPSGACAINNPALNFWLHQPYSLRRSQLQHWLEEVDIIRKITALMLGLIRDSNSPKFQNAYQGFYELSLDAKQPSQLIRVELPAEANIYPEISAGRHRLCIRFMQMDFNGGTQQTTRDITFKLTCCII